MNGPGKQAPRGRGASTNPAGRFERLEIEPVFSDESGEEMPPERVATQFLQDTSRSVIAYNQSPDVGFDASINPYRGCEHGCTYCYARTTHEYLGFSAGLDFETRILVKENAPELLAAELAAPKWVPQPLGMSGVTDAYQPIERKLELTRRCLEVLVRFRNPVVIVTKNHLVTRDLDLLGELARHDAISVFLSITTLDPKLARRMEPRTSHPEKRLEAIEKLAAAGIPVGVNVAPVVPALTDHEMPRILEAAVSAGASRARYILLRLPGAVEDLFVSWLEERYPLRKEHVVSRIRALRRGGMNDTRFGIRGRGEGIFADQMRSIFRTTCRRLGLDRTYPALNVDAFRRDQLDLFER